MKVMQFVMETVAKYAPDQAPDPLLHAHRCVGQGVSRVDGALKVTGSARFTAEFEVENLAYAALVCSTIARGRVSGFDLSETNAAAGVLAVMTHHNAPP